MSTTAADPVKERFTTLELHEVTVDTRLQMRLVLDPNWVDELAGMFAEGIEIEPITVVYDGASFWLVDGFHRYYAAEQAGKRRIDARVLEGGWELAEDLAVGANSRHGLTRTNADKRKAVLYALGLPRYAALSDREIAGKCGCNHSFVGRLRKQTEADANSAPYGESGATLVPNTKMPFAPSIGTQPANTPDFLGDDAIDEGDAEPGEDGLLEYLGEALRAVGNLLTAASKRLRDYAADPERGGHAARVVTRHTTDLERIRGAIRGLEPVEWCQRCDGQGCNHCLGTGFLTRYQAQQREPA